MGLAKRCLRTWTLKVSQILDEVRRGRFWALNREVARLYLSI